MPEHHFKVGDRVVKDYLLGSSGKAPSGEVLALDGNAHIVVRRFDVDSTTTYHYTHWAPETIFNRVAVGVLKGEYPIGEEEEPSLHSYGNMLKRVQERLAAERGESDDSRV